MSEIITVQDLETLKKHEIFEAEVLTGKVGGLASGANIDYATNQATGQVQKTMPAILRDIGFTPAAFDFSTGGTLNTGDYDLAVYNPAPNGDNNWYSWGGELPKTIAAGSTPQTTGGFGAAAWSQKTDNLLRGDLSSSEYQFSPGSVVTPFDPTRLSYGPGTVSHSGFQFKNLAVGVHIPYASFFMTPEDAIDGFDLGFPPDGNGKYNAVMSVGAHPELAPAFNRMTVFGTANLTKAIGVDRCEAFGTGALQYMRYGERNTMLGSIAGQWLGTNDPAGDNHEWWVNAGGFVPGQPGWDYGGFETANPGIGAKIAGRTDFATSSDQCARNLGLARDAFNGSVKLMNCVALGYRAMASAYMVDNSTAVGVDAFKSGIFLHNSVGLGYSAGPAWQEGERNLVAGYNSGLTVVKGDKNTLLGAYAGSAFAQMNECLFIGHGAGNVLSTAYPNPANLLAIGNDVSGIGIPLIVGNMASPKLGINIMPEKVAGTLHVRTSDQTASPVVPSGAADDCIIESAGNTGITIRSGATSAGAVNFSSPTLASNGAISYSHSTNEINLRANNGDRWAVAAASFNPQADNVYSVGTALKRPSVIYAGTGAINTSDGREKTAPLPITDAVLDAWADVQIITFQWLESIAQKGEDVARWHFGVIAQQVRDAFLTRGLDGTRYGLLCYDEWEAQPDIIDEDGAVIQGLPAGNRWGIRPDQCLFLEAAYQRRRCDKIEARLYAAGL